MFRCTLQWISIILIYSTSSSQRNHPSLFTLLIFVPFNSKHTYTQNFFFPQNGTWFQAKPGQIFFRLSWTVCHGNPCRGLQFLVRGASAFSPLQTKAATFPWVPFLPIFLSLNFSWLFHTTESLHFRHPIHVSCLLSKSKVCARNLEKVYFLRCAVSWQPWSVVLLPWFLFL